MCLQREPIAMLQRKFKGAGLVGGVFGWVLFVHWLYVDGDVMRRLPYFVELDAAAFDPGQQALYVRPGVLLKEATRYVVAFRNLRTVDGQPIAPSRPFVRLRDGKTIVLVTHDQELAAKYATQVVKLRDGKVMEVGV